jgi:hypothetical protein
MRKLPRTWPAQPTGTSTASGRATWTIPKNSVFVPPQSQPLDRCPSIEEMFKRRQCRPPMGSIVQFDKEGLGKYMYHAMPGDHKELSLWPVGAAADTSLEAAIAKAVMSNFEAEFPQLAAQAKALGVWLEGDSVADALKTVPGDKKPVLDQAVKAAEGSVGTGLLSKLCLHTVNGFRLNFAAKDGLRKVMQDNPNRTGTFHFKKGDLFLQFPDRARNPVVGAQPRYHGTAYAPRPFVARFFIATTAVSTGKHSAPRDHEWLPPGTLQLGVPSRSFVPVFHWTGSDAGEPQEYALLFRTNTKGEHLGSEDPAGMGAFGDSFF